MTSSNKNEKTITVPHEVLAKLPTSYLNPQCVQVGKEILVCGGSDNNQCYSFHTVKNAYKEICAYPKSVKLKRHVVVKYINQSGDVMLLSFGGLHRHTLQMRYRSVWKEEEEEEEEEEKEKEKINEWIPCPCTIGKPGDNMFDARGVIGGSKNHLLFVLHQPNQMVVFDLSDSVKYVTKGDLPTTSIMSGCCFVRTRPCEMALLSNTEVLLIKFDERTCSFQFDSCAMHPLVRYTFNYAYIYVKDLLVLFGGFDSFYLNKVRVYSLKKRACEELTFKLPTSLDSSFAIINDDNTCVHLIGGFNGVERSTQHYRIRLFHVVPIEKLFVFSYKNAKTEIEVTLLMQSWLRSIKMHRFGWIKEFDAMIAQFLSTLGLFFSFLEGLYTKIKYTAQPHTQHIGTTNVIQAAHVFVAIILHFFFCICDKSIPDARACPTSITLIINVYVILLHDKYLFKKFRMVTNRQSKAL
ncbi:hypothetical protein RFI_16272 [Reticulomyxa filosa]|uniref:Uncharacterized protein n=1 Tax=Reticulomyxa filosa TaxID=46433 RepID=X6N4K8_RETFI|nr:hypothetical protein RFI_16272 [Reticulomyxa filosa]|eukprot:ETO20931.1 hypothetical protein RFI_16272 [Reticulomyxa filosa]